MEINAPVPSGYDSEAVDYGHYTGLETARRIKAIKPQVKIIALTTHSKRDLRIKQSGHFFKIIEKPLDPKDLLFIIKHIK